MLKFSFSNFRCHSRKQNFIALCLTALLLTLISPTSFAIDLKAHPKVSKITDELVAEGVYTDQELEKIFQGAEIKQSILDAMQNPAEYKFTWGKYRKLFLQDDRIQQGVDFWLEYEEHFDRAEKEYGVPSNIIAAIIGVESKFGKYKGKHRVLDSLVTLVVGFERRSKFFAGELKEFLVLCKNNNLPVDQVLGSYAGAVGFPQFISSSYRAYAVDFSGDGRTDLIDQPIDAIGSVANYFVKNGWISGQPVVSEAMTSVPSKVLELASRKRKVMHSARLLRELGAIVGEEIPGDEKLGVLELNASEVVPDASKSNTYLVRAGDTACQIAEQHKVSCKSLFALNKLNERGAIFRGQRLKIPSTKANSSKVAGGSKRTVNADSGKWVIAKNGSAEMQHNDNSEILRYFLTHENFYVITRYNQSVLYAMAVHDLSEAIAEARQKRD